MLKRMSLGLRSVMLVYRAKSLILAKGLRWLLARLRLGRKGSAVAGEMPDLWGAMAGSVRIAPGTDLTKPTGEVWKADR